MATDKGYTEAQTVDTGRAAGHPDIPIQVKIMQVPARCGPSAAMQPPPTAAGVTKGNSVSPHPKVPPAGQSTHPTSSTVADSALQTSSAVMVIAKVATPGGGTANGQPQVTKPTLSQVASMNQTTMSGRTMMITVPRTGSPQTLAVAPRLPQVAAPQLPANIHIPPGMMLIRSDSGQLMLVSQQALAQAQQGSRSIIGQAPRILTQQVSVAAGNKINEKVNVIRMTAPPRFQPAPGQKTAVVKVIGVSPKKVVVQNLSPVSDQGRQPRMQAVVIETKKEPPTTYSQETMESVKKCKNFLVTLIKLASSGSRSANMANNVKGLVQSLLEGRLEAEEFTQQLYQELKSTPQPCLVPFLKKSLPAVRCLTPDPQLFIQQASTPTNNSTMNTKHTNADTGKKVSSGQQIIQPLRGLTLRPEMMTLPQSRYCNTKSSRPSPKHTVVQPGKHFTGTISLKQTFSRDPSQLNKSAFPDSSGSYKEDDDINDVASMAGVNLREENAQIFTTIVGSVVQSCQDQPFLSHCPVLNRILHTGQAFGVTEIGPEVVALVSHATQECLRGLIEKLTVMAEHRKEAFKCDLSHTKVSDVRGQLRFLEEVESLKKKRKDEEERERLLRLAKIRSHTDDLQHQQLKQRAKELQQIEEAQLQQREANLTALAAIGPRKKRALEQSQSKVTLLPRPGFQRVNRVVLKDLLLCLEQEHFFRHSLTFYKALF